MAEYLFIFSIGPVQSFIAQARKTQDLYAGSQLLSDLIGDAIAETETLLGNEHFTLIFPAKDLASKPNRFVAKLCDVTEDTAAQLGRDVEQYIRGRFAEIADAAYQHAKIQRTPPDIFFTQIERQLEVYWAAKLMQEDYHEEYPAFETLFGATKSIRPFAQLSETGRKCSVCGERNVLFCGEGRAAKEKMQMKPHRKLLSDTEDAVAKHYNATIQSIFASPMPQREGLCAVCFTKRFYPFKTDEQKRRKGFPSIAEIALSKQILEDEALLFTSGGVVYPPDKRGPLDLQMVYEENLTDTYLRKEGIAYTLAEIQARRHELLKRLKERNIAERNLARYYALIKLDVDRMGQWLSGELLPVEQKKRLEEFHGELSRRLAEFASYAENSVELPKRETVFAGGDDFLGFVNLFDLFMVLKKLRLAFEQQVNQPLKTQFQFTRDITFSAGICIAHYKTPLGDVLAWARMMEKDAKKAEKQGGGGRNAFGIAAFSHSGHIKKTILRWGDMCDGSGSSDFDSIVKSAKQQDLCADVWLGNLDAMATIVNILQKEGGVSRACITRLEQEFRPLVKEHRALKVGTVTLDVVHTEITRLVERAKNENTSKETVRLMSECMYALYKGSRSFDNFLFALHIADMIKREAGYEK